MSVTYGWFDVLTPLGGTPFPLDWGITNNPFGILPMWSSYGGFWSSDLGVSIDSSIVNIAGWPGILSARDDSQSAVGAFITYNAHSSGAAIQAYKTRAHLSTAPTTSVSSGDEVLLFQPFAANGSSYQQLAGLRAVVDGVPSGTSMPGRWEFQTTPAGSNVPVERMRIDNKGNALINTAAIGTTATDGFLYIPTCAGAPTGVPTTYTGRVPMVFDTTNSQFWFFTGGVWKQPKTPAAAAIVTWQ